MVARGIIMAVSGLTVFSFFLNGMVSLASWNAVLCSLNYFDNVYSGQKVYSYFPLPLFAGYLVVALSYHTLSQNYSYISLIIVGNIITTLSLIFLVVVSSVLSDSAGFYLCMLLCFMIGVSTNCMQLTYFAMINYLSSDVVSKFTVGTAASGLVLTAIRMILVAALGADPSLITPIIIYIAIAIAFNNVNLYLNILFCRSQQYREFISSALPLSSPSKLPSKINELIESVDSDANVGDVNVGDVNVGDVNVGDANGKGGVALLGSEDGSCLGYFAHLWECGKGVYPYHLVIMLNFVLTFMLFPGPSVIPQFSMGQVWSTLLFLMMYNIGDTVGKYLAGLKDSHNGASTIFLFVARLYFVLTITIMATGASSGDVLIDNNFFPFINQLLFGLTNGLVINCSFIQAFAICPDHQKKYAGVLCGITLQIGLMLGTAVEIPYAIIAGI